MTVKELKEALAGADENLEVRVVADHSQVYMSTDSVSIAKTLEGSDEWMIEGLIDDDEVEEGDEIYTFICIS